MEPRDTRTSAPDNGWWEALSTTVPVKATVSLGTWRGGESVPPGAAEAVGKGRKPRTATNSSARSVPRPETGPTCDLSAKDGILRGARFVGENGCQDHVVESDRTRK